MSSPASPSPSVGRLARGCLAALLGAAAAAALGIGAAAPASAVPQELVFIEHAASDATTDTGAKGDSAGDILTFANEVFDAQDATRVGNDQGMCVRTVAGSAWECFWTLTLAAGQITVQGPFYDSGDSVLAITGGTGAYANAQGDMLLSAVGTDGSKYRFTYRLL
ncbi:Allene oxide cyclase [Mycolicibacterium moriokaense]|nr:Allene oxide cyclase [Mycolicibacterium moriokaense]